MLENNLIKKNYIFIYMCLEEKTLLDNCLVSLVFRNLIKKIFLKHHILKQIT
jgi:hypothetical protein